MIRSVILQAPEKFYDVVPIFVEECKKRNLFDKYYIATDFKGASIDGCFILHLEKDYHFSGNILRLLPHVKEEVFYLIVEDHIPEDNDIDIMNRHLSHVINNKEIGFLRLSHGSSVKLRKIKNGIGNMDKSYEYYISLQPAIWRKSFLSKVLKDGENAWIAEINGSKRAKKIKSFISCGVSKTIFNHSNFYSKGKYIRNQYIDYCIKNGMEIPKNRKIYYKKSPISLDEYLKIRNSK